MRVYLRLRPILDRPALPSFLSVDLANGRVTVPEEVRRRLADEDPAVAAAARHDVLRVAGAVLERHGLAREPQIDP